jgi:hypothetical protein
LPRHPGHDTLLFVAFGGRFGGFKSTGLIVFSAHLEEGLSATLKLSLPVRISQLTDRQ